MKISVRIIMNYEKEHIRQSEITLTRGYTPFFLILEDAIECHTILSFLILHRYPRSAINIPNVLINHIPFAKKAESSAVFTDGFVLLAGVAFEEGDSEVEGVTAGLAVGLALGVGVGVGVVIGVGFGFFIRQICVP